MRSLRKDMHRTLPKNVQARICYTDTKCLAKFNKIKDPVKKFTNIKLPIMLHVPNDEAGRILKHPSPPNKHVPTQSNQ